MRGSRLPEAVMDNEAVHLTLQKLEAAQREVSDLLSAERYDDALAQSEAMYRLATSLPPNGNPAQIDMLRALASTHQEMSAHVASALQMFQTTGRKRQKAISAYGRR